MEQEIAQDLAQALVGGLLDHYGPYIKLYGLIVSLFGSGAVVGAIVMWFRLKALVEQVTLIRDPDISNVREDISDMKDVVDITKTMHDNADKHGFGTERLERKVDTGFDAMLTCQKDSTAAIHRLNETMVKIDTTQTMLVRILEAKL